MMKSGTSPSFNPAITQLFTKRQNAGSFSLFLKQNGSEILWVERPPSAATSPAPVCCGKSKPPAAGVIRNRWSIPGVSNIFGKGAATIFVGWFAVWKRKKSHLIGIPERVSYCLIFAI